MSWYREIKTLLTFSILLLSFIIWSFLINLFGKIDINHNLFLITSLGCFIMQGIYNKWNNKHSKIISCVIPLVFSIPLYFLNHTIFAATAYTVYNVAMVFYMNSIEEHPVDYTAYKDMSLKALRVFFAVSILTMIVNKEFASELFRYYVFLLVIIVMLLKESRNFMFKIRSRYSKYFNLFMSGAILLVCFSKGEIILKFFKNCILFVVDKILFVVFWILKYPLNLLADAIAKLSRSEQAQSQKGVLDEFAKKLEGRDLFEEANKLQGNNHNYIFQSVKIILFILIMFLIVKAFLKFMSKSKASREDAEEIREQIKTAKENQRDGKFKRLFRKIFRGNLSINMRIFEVFKEFQIKTEKKEIFKNYMTASQLKEITKIHVDKYDELDQMSIIYNEAKFSDHDINEEEYRKIKESYNEIKKQL